MIAVLVSAAIHCLSRALKTETISQVDASFAPKFPNAQQQQQALAAKPAVALILGKF